jgi:hypothetical protein
LDFELKSGVFKKCDASNTHPPWLGLRLVKVFWLMQGPVRDVGKHVKTRTATATGTTAIHKLIPPTTCSLSTHEREAQTDCL